LKPFRPKSNLDTYTIRFITVECVDSFQVFVKSNCR